ALLPGRASSFASAASRGLKSPGRRCRQGADAPPVVRTARTAGAVRSGCSQVIRGEPSAVFEAWVADSALAGLRHSWPLPRLKGSTHTIAGFAQRTGLENWPRELE